MKKALAWLAVIGWLRVGVLLIELRMGRHTGAVVDIEKIVEGKRDDARKKFEKIPDSDVVDSLDNADDVRGTADAGADRLGDKLDDGLSRLGSSGIPLPGGSGDGGNTG